MNGKLIIVAVLGLLGGGLIALIANPDARQAVFAPPGPIVTGKALIGGPFRLLGVDGKPVTERDFAGRPMLVMFGFTSCPDICPAGLQVVSAALERLGDAHKRFAPIFITLDPERDTPDKLGQYMSSFHPGIVGLTGSVDDVGAAAKAYRVYFKKVEDKDSGGSYTIDHSSFFYIMNAKGEFHAHVPHSASPDVLATRLRSAL